MPLPDSRRRQDVGVLRARGRLRTLCRPVIAAGLLILTLRLSPPDFGTVAFLTVASWLAFAAYVVRAGDSGRLAVWLHPALAVRRPAAPHGRGVAIVAGVRASLAALRRRAQRA